RYSSSLVVLHPFLIQMKKSRERTPDPYEVEFYSEHRSHGKRLRSPQATGVHRAVHRSFGGPSITRITFPQLGWFICRRLHRSPRLVSANLLHDNHRVNTRN